MAVHRRGRADGAVWSAVGEHPLLPGLRRVRGRNVRMAEDLPGPGPSRGEKKDHSTLEGLRLVPLFGRDSIPLVVHMYNPFVADRDIEVFLGRFCEESKGGTKLRDDLGVWTGKRRYIVKLREKPGSPGESVH